MFALWYLSLFVNKHYYLKDKQIMAMLECDFKRLEEAECTYSLLKIHLTRELFERSKYKMTPRGSSLHDVIRSGCEHLDSIIGVYAPGPMAYTIFQAVFNPIIQDFHNGFTASSRHGPKVYGDINYFRELDPSGEYVLATKIRCSRNLRGFPFVPTMTECHFLETEHVLRDIVESFCDQDMVGEYYPYGEIDDGTKSMLRDNQAFFSIGDRFMEAGNLFELWCTGRGIFINNNKTLVMFVNQEDHMMLTVSDEGSDLRCVYQRYQDVMAFIEERTTFERHERLGHLTACPSNLGTGLRASVKIHLPHLGEREEDLEDLCEENKLTVHTCGNSLYDISNKERLGVTQFECLKRLQNGILELIQVEKSAGAFFGLCEEAKRDELSGSEIFGKSQGPCGPESDYSTAGETDTE